MIKTKEGEQIAPTIGFGWIKRNIGVSEGYVFIITVRYGAKLLEVFRKSGLECLEIAKDPEYRANLGLDEGIGVYVKKYTEEDADYSKGLSTGLTIYETYCTIIKCIEEAMGIKGRLEADSIEKLNRFKKSFTEKGFDWETVKLVVMPELEDFDTLLSVVTSTKQKQLKINTDDGSCDLYLAMSFYKLHRFSSLQSSWYFSQLQQEALLNPACKGFCAVLGTSMHIYLLLAKSHVLPTFLYCPSESCTSVCSSSASYSPSYLK
eukprot:TRINITY_DN72652_c0_g1_i1.p2 TRINITY_DN72652_c0_g1~~TRINITY_DN72652_c0_g1_i1.p2  ORF type:complete len:263 (+),score=22.63 TRINITY_DN72652_c0_g1_i1:882-1670(+)